MASRIYLERLRQLSDAMLKLQRPIRVLDALRWPSDIETTFCHHDGKKLPALPKNLYAKESLNLDVKSTKDKFNALRKDVSYQLGKDDALAKILVESIDSQLLSLDLITNRGTPAFGEISRALYGSASDKLRGDNNTLRDLGEQLCRIFALPNVTKLNHLHHKDLSAKDAVTILRRKMNKYFEPGIVKVALSDDITSDASAGGDLIRMNSRSRFSELDLNVLAVHEGWVHIGTNLNGRTQPYATWLGYSSPRTTAMQEGLAVLMETLTLSSFPARAKRISDRVVAVDMAERGADFCEVYRYFRETGSNRHDSFRVAQRVFRGGLLTGGSVFTKDIAYVRGYVENVNFLRSAIYSGSPELLPYFFIGKATLEDLPVLYERANEGVIVPPTYLPDMFKQVSGLAVWFGFSSSMSLMDLAKVQNHFNELFTQPSERDESSLSDDIDTDHD
jgi:uncharacterized protein (TIGR02421 family)